MPVYHKDSDKCVGFVDVLDILAFIVKNLRSLGSVDPRAAMQTWSKHDFFKVTPVSEAVNASGRNSCVTISKVILMPSSFCARTLARTRPYSKRLT